MKEIKDMSSDKKTVMFTNWVRALSDKLWIDCVVIWVSKKTNLEQGIMHTAFTIDTLEEWEDMTLEAITSFSVAFERVKTHISLTLYTKMYALFSSLIKMNTESMVIFFETMGDFIAMDNTQRVKFIQECLVKKTMK